MYGKASASVQADQHEYALVMIFFVVVIIIMRKRYQSSNSFDDDDKQKPKDIKKRNKFINIYRD